LSPKFVVSWTQSPSQNCAADNRGWRKGKTRTHTEAEKKLVKTVRNKLDKSNKESYIGPEAILRYIKKNRQEYERGENINIDSINISFIINTLKELKLSRPNKRRVKGGSEYQRYPKTLIHQIGKLILEIDFIQRFIKGQTKPLHFIGLSCKTLKLRQYRRISGQTSLNTVKQLNWFFETCFIPDATKMDNDLAFIGSSSAKRTISKTIQHLFSKKIIPIFTNQRSPWNNGSVEGSNSVFARNFWNKHEFKSVQGVDRKLKLFNQASLEYSHYGQSELAKKENENFVPQVYFIRKAHEDRRKSGKGEISILNNSIKLPGKYINLYTLSRWNLKTEMLYIYFENEGKKVFVKKLKFPINKNCQIKI
jgi:hypothetical protein